jgi:hypothetical protein
MSPRLSRGAAALWLTAAMTIAFGVRDTPARADINLIGWTAQADANPFDLVVDNNAGLGGVHPLSEIVLPEDTSDFESGPFGHALASIFWPGAVIGNLHSIAGQAGVPPQLAPLFANDPVRAESFFPSGPQSATYPPGSPGNVAEMQSHADQNGVWSKAGLSDVSVPGLFDVQTTQGNTTAAASDHASSSASGSIHSLSLLGGVIQVGATSSTASATSDGVSPTGHSTTHVGAVTIAGLPVSYGSDGLTVGSAHNNLPGSLLGSLDAIANQLVAALNLKIEPLPHTETRQAPAEEVTSGGLAVSFSLPPNLTIPSLNCNSLPPQLAQLGILCHLPDELNGLHFTFTIGRVRATAIAAQPFPFVAGDLSGVTGATGTGPATGLIAGGGSAAPSAGALTGTEPAPATAGAARSGSGVGTINPISLSSPVTAGLLLALLALAVLLGANLPRLARTLEEPVAVTCPGEEDR